MPSSEPWITKQWLAVGHVLCQKRGFLTIKILQRKTIWIERVFFLTFLSLGEASSTKFQHGIKMKAWLFSIKKTLDWNQITRIELINNLQTIKLTFSSYYIWTHKNLSSREPVNFVLCLSVWCLKIFTKKKSRQFFVKI